MVNKVETEQAIAVMQAWMDGKPIQYNTYSTGKNWIDLPAEAPVWNWQNYTYRIKPEPTKVYVVFSCCHKRICTKDTMHEALRARDIGTGRYVKEFVEVM